MEENEISDKIVAENLTVNQKVEIERKRTEEGTKRENMIASEEGIIDVVDLINNSENNAIAIRIKTLLENGVTEDMLKSKYMDISSGVSDRNVALENLRTVCDIFIRYVSEQANGIVINPITGEVDQKKSLESAVEYGIIRGKDVGIFDPIDQIFELHKETSFTEILNSSKFFTTQEKEDIYMDANRCFYNLMKNPNFNFGLDWLEDETLKDAFGETEEENVKENNEMKKNRNTNEDELNFIMKLYMLSKKDFTFRDGELEKYLKKYENEEFYKNILNENGKIDVNTIKKYLEVWTKKKNDANLRFELSKYILFTQKTGIKLEELDEVNKDYLKKLLAKGFFATGSNKKAFGNLCKNLGIKSDLETILEVTGCKSEEELKELKNANEINEKTYSTILYEEKRDKKMSSAEKMIFEFTENLNLNKEEEREAIARLFVLFEEKRKNSSPNSRDEIMYKEVTDAIQYYMIKNKEYFSEYMILLRNTGVTDKNKLTPDRVRSILEKKEAERIAQNKELQGKKTTSLLKSLPHRIEKVLDQFRETSENQISQEEVDAFFKERSEEIVIAYEQEKQQRSEQNKKKTVEFMDDDKSDIEKSALYKMDNVTDIFFANAMIFYGQREKSTDQEKLNASMFQFRKSKYYSIVLDEDGNIDLEMLKKFKDRWIEERNKAALKEELVEYLLFARDENVVFEDLNEVNKANLKNVLARGFLTEDRRNKIGFEKLCEYLNIGTDLNSILAATGCSSKEELENIRNDYEIDSKNYRYHLFEAKAKNEMSASDKMIFELTENLDLRNEDNRDAIAQLYLMYAEKIRLNSDGTYESNLGKEMSSSIEKYMLANKAYFAEYMTVIPYSGNVIKNKIDDAHVKKVLEQKDISKTSEHRAGMLNGKIKNIFARLENVNGQLTQEAFNEFFYDKNENFASEYKTEAIERLKQRNREKLEETEAQKAGDAKSDDKRNVTKKVDDGKTDTKKSDVRESNAIKKDNGKAKVVKIKTEEKKQNPFVSWVKKAAENVRDSFKKMISRNSAGKLDSKETKLLEEPKEKVQPTNKQTSNGFVQIVDVDHGKALEEMKKAEDRVVDEQEVIETK